MAPLGGMLLGGYARSECEEDTDTCKGEGKSENKGKGSAWARRFDQGKGNNKGKGNNEGKGSNKGKGPSGDLIEDEQGEQQPTSKGRVWSTWF